MDSDLRGAVSHRATPAASGGAALARSRASPTTRATGAAASSIASVADLTRDESGPAARGERRRLRLSYLLPVVLFIGLAIALGWGLTRDPRQIPSVLIDKPVPEFALPPVQGRTLGLASADLKEEVSLVNVFASWCTACLQEHPLFMRLRDDGVVPIHGLNYKDRPEDAARWLDRLGDPYTRTGADRDGPVAIDWGVYGVPETFVVGRDGRIAYKHIGAVTPEVLRTRILPLVDALRRGAAGPAASADGSEPERTR